MKKLIAFLLLSSGIALAQINQGVVSVTGGVLIVSSAPSGACSQGVANQQLVTTGIQYSCQNITAGTGTWGILASGNTSTNLAGGAAKAIPYQSAASTTVFDVTNYSWDDANTYLAIGPALNLTNFPGTKLSIVGTSGSQNYLQAFIQDLNVNGQGCLIAEGDNATNSTHYGEFCFNGSGTAIARGLTNIYFANPNAFAQYSTDSEYDFGVGLVTGSGGTFNWYANQYTTPNMVLTGTALTMGTGVNIVTPGSVSSATRLTATNCTSTAAPAICASASAGSVVVAALGTTVVVNTTAVTANSQIFVQEDSSLGTKLSVTCNVTPATAPPVVTARVAATSFTITTTAPTTNPRCFSYSIIN